jgi:hypothetical protein
MNAVARLHERLDGRERGVAGFMAPGCGRHPLPPGIAPTTKTNPRSALESTKVLKNEPKTNPNEPKCGTPALAEVLQNQRCFERPPRTNPKRTQKVIRLAVCLNCLQKCGLHAIRANPGRASSSMGAGDGKRLDVYTWRRKLHARRLRRATVQGVTKASDTGPRAAA